MFNSSSLEQHRIRDVFRRALISLMRETMKNIFQCIHHSAAAVLRREDRHPGAALYNPCLLPGSGRAAAIHAGEVRGLRWSCSVGVRPGLPLAAARSWLVLVSAWCKKYVSHCLVGAHRSQLFAWPTPTETSPPVCSCLDPILAAASHCPAQ